jgi:hypothetical protein
LLLVAGCGGSSGASGGTSTAIGLPSPVPATSARVSGPLHFTAALAGTVTDARDHSPIAGAVVGVGGGVRSARTDAEGRFRVEFPAGRAVGVTVTATGYVQALGNGTLRRGQTAHVHFQLNRIVTGQPPVPSQPITFGQP